VQFILRQAAEKDVKFNFDAEIVFQVNDGTLIMTTTVYTNEGPISGTRQFSQWDLDMLTDLTPKSSSRRASMCGSTKNSRPTTVSASRLVESSRRRSRTASPRKVLRRESAEETAEKIPPELANNPLFQKNKSPERKKRIDHGKPRIDVSQH
jgi:hypothetical protein